MKASIQDPQALQALSPLDIAAYLRTRGWQEVDADPRASRWVLRQKKEEFEVLLPLDRQLRDYALRLSELLSSLAAVEQRSQLQILADLTTAGADILRFRPVHASFEDGSIPLHLGLAVIQGARDMLLASACSAMSPQPFFTEPVPLEAQRYVQSLRIKHTESGSFALAILSPVPPEFEGAFSRYPDVDEPFERRVVKTFLRALSAIQGAATESMATGKIEPFERSVEVGASANLCAALASLQEETGAEVEIDVTWAAVRAMREGEVPSKVRFSQDVSPVLKEAGRVLRERAGVSDPVDWYSRALNSQQQLNRLRPFLEARYSALDPVRSLIESINQTIADQVKSLHDAEDRLRQQALEADEAARQIKAG